MKGVATVILVMLVIAIAFSAALSIRTFTTSSYGGPVMVELIDKYCQNNTAYFVVRNGENTTLAKNSFNCTKSDNSCFGGCVVDNIPPNGAAYVKIYNCSSGTHSYELKNNASTLSLSVSC